MIQDDVNSTEERIMWLSFEEAKKIEDEIFEIISENNNFDMFDFRNVWAMELRNIIRSGINEMDKNIVSIDP